MTVPPIPSHAEAVAAVAACGVPAANIQATFAPELQMDTIIISDLGSVDPERLACVRGAVHPYYFLHIERPDQHRAYFAFAGRADRRESHVRARQLLSEQGRIHLVPNYRSEAGLAPFAAALERACNLSEGTALRVFGTDVLTFQPGFLERDYGNFERLSNMFSASNAYEHGIELGLVGNDCADEGSR